MSQCGSYNADETLTVSYADDEVSSKKIAFQKKVTLERITTGQVQVKRSHESRSRPPQDVLRVGGDLYVHDVHAVFGVHHIADNLNSMAPSA